MTEPHSYQPKTPAAEQGTTADDPLNQIRDSLPRAAVRIGEHYCAGRCRNTDRPHREATASQHSKQSVGQAPPDKIDLPSNKQKL